MSIFRAIERKRGKERERESKTGWIIIKKYSIQTVKPKHMHTVYSMLWWNSGHFNTTYTFSICCACTSSVYSQSLLRLKSYQNPINVFLYLYSTSKWPTPNASNRHHHHQARLCIKARNRGIQKKVKGRENIKNRVLKSKRKAKMKKCWLFLLGIRLGEV